MRFEKGDYASPRWSWEILDCGMPMTFDTYSNCAHQCVYCFAFFQRAIGDGADNYLQHKVRAVNVEKVKRMFLDPDRYARSFAPYIKARYVLQWGGLSDGFDWYEKNLGKSLELLRFFREIDYPVSISTKGVWFVDHPDYVEVLRGAKNTHWKYSIICLDERKSKALEAGTPTPDERFEAMRKLNDLGVGATTLRFRPFVIGVSDLDFEPMFERAKEVGCHSVTTEFLCIEKRASPNHRARYRAMSEVVGYDVWTFYRTHSYSGSGLMRLNYEIKRPYVRRMEEVAERVGLPFYVSDAHHKEASAGGGCCGLPDTGPLSNYNRGQFSEAMQIAKARGKVHWSDIAEQAAWLKEVPYIDSGTGSINFGTSGVKAKNLFHSMFEYMRDVWNTPKSWSSPARYFGGALVPAGVDDEGDVIYVYNEPYIKDGEQARSVPELLQKLEAFKRKSREDGAAQGHVSYPIFVPSKGRAGRATVVDQLSAARLNATIVVEPQEEKAYRESYPEADLLVLPESERGIVYVRQFILDRARSEGLAWYWQIDDNIRGFKQGKESVSARAALSYVEGLVSEYERVGLASLDYQQFSWMSEVDFSPGRGCYCCVLTNTATGLDYDEDVAMKEDVDFSIQHLAAGWPTIRVHRFSMVKPTMGGGADKSAVGGLADQYRDGRDAKAAERLVAKWPAFVKLKDKGHTTDAAVSWKMLEVPLQATGLK